MLIFPLKDYARCLKHSWESLRTDLANEKKIWNSRIKARSILEQKKDIKIELGSGPKYGAGDWITIDKICQCDLYWDLSRALPFPKESVDEIYSSHLLEHFTYKDLIYILEGCYKVLKPNGRFSACVPDASIYLKAYFEPSKFDATQYCKYKLALSSHSAIDYVNYIAYMGGHHKYMFDSQNLVNILQKVGFKKANLRSFEPTLDRIERDYQSIYVVGEK